MSMLVRQRHKLLLYDIGSTRKGKLIFLGNQLEEMYEIELQINEMFVD